MMRKLHGIFNKAFPALLLGVPFILAVFDIMTLKMPLKWISAITVFCLLAAVVLFFFRVRFMPPAKNFSMPVAIITLASLFGAYTAGIVSISILKLYFDPQNHHYFILLFSIALLIFSGNGIFSRCLHRFFASFRDPVRTSAGQTITPMTELKIGQAVAYLNDNYKFDISREGLSERLGLSVDHLSRKFKKYMGRRMGDYINELRVRDAAVCLRDSQDRIIDIAYDNGFESLATFNRVFLKIIGETPRDYRKRFRNQTLCAPQKVLQEANQLID